jgi:hypothetical protein
VPKHYEPSDEEMHAWVESMGAAAREGRFPLDLRVRLGWTPENVERFGKNMDLPEEFDPFKDLASPPAPGDGDR